MYIWNLFKEMDNIQHQLGDISNLSDISGLSLFPSVSRNRFPLINLSENDQNLIIEASAPGLDTNTLKVSADREKLTISGEIVATNTGEGPFHKRERTSNKFSRSIELPFPINTEGIIAEYKNGILAITLPKIEEIKPKHIDIKLS